MRLNNKEFRAEVKALLREGWTMEPGGHHFKLKTPCGRLQCAVSNSPSRVHAVNDFRKQIAQMRRRLAEMSVSQTQQKEGVSK